MQTKKWGHFDIVTNSDNRVAIQNVIKNANAQRTTQHFPLIMPAIVLAIALATGCSNPDATTDDQTGGGTPRAEEPPAVRVLVPAAYCSNNAGVSFRV